MLPDPDPAVSIAAPPLDRLLARRLPADGPLLAVGELASRHAPDRSGVERRPGRDRQAPLAASLAPGGWRAILLGDRPGADAFVATDLAALRDALTPEGRLFVLAPPPDLDSRATLSDLIGTLYESGFCLLHEDDVEAGHHRATVLEARPDPYVVRSYRDGDEAAIARLFAESFSPARGLDHWRWKYRDNPFGTLAISCAFAPDGELVAHYAAYPVRFRRSRDGVTQTLLCHQVGDTMTERRHRHVGRGRTSLLGRTARHFYARRCEGKVAFNYGFNTGNIQRFSQLFVGARKVWDLDLWGCRIADLRLDAPRRLRPYRVSRVDRTDSSFDLLFERVAEHFGLLVERRRPYLDWRYLRCPGVPYRLYRVDRGGRLVGWAVIRADGDRLRLGDALFHPEHPEAVSAMLRAATADRDGEVAAAGGSRSPRVEEGRIEGWFSRHPRWWSERLDALGLTAAPEPQGLGMVFVPFLECPDRELERGYYLTMGDSDLF